LDRTLVLIVLLIAVIANVVIIGLALLTLRRRGGAADDRGPAPGGILAALPPTSTTRPPTAGPVPSLAGAAPSASVASPAAAPISPTSFITVAAMTDRASDDSSIPTNSSGRWSLPPHDDPRAESTIQALVHGDMGAAGLEDPGDPLVDPVTGFATLRAWDEAFQNEDHRLARYGRPVTLLVAELDGLDALAARLGQEPADRLIPPVAAALRQNARAADIFARVAHTRFVALLPETDEVAAINYVERVRTACDMWLAAGAVAVRLAIGWAQTPPGGRLSDALRLADDRMNADRRRQGGGTARSVAQDAGEAAPPSGGTTEPALPPTPTGEPGLSAPAPEARAASPETTDASSSAPAPAPVQPRPPFVPDGPYPGSSGTVPAPISVIDGQKTYY
jgi:diguanylate cyclase (GGDEF)-like protein